MTTRSSEWQLSAYAPGQIVEGAESLNQSIALVLGTRRGSDPFRPAFGSALFEYIDKPINVAGPAIVREIQNSIGRWVTAIKIKSVTYTYQDSFGSEQGQPSGLRFNIVWVPSGSTDPNELNFLITTTPSVDIPAAALIRVLSNESDMGLVTESGQFITLI